LGVDQHDFAVAVDDHHQQMAECVDSVNLMLHWCRASHLNNSPIKAKVRTPGGSVYD
jgi:hypothetical protein